MRYRLRTLMIALAILPPLLAPILAAAIRLPHSGYLAIGLGAFSAFWLACGFFWLLFMRVVEPLFERKPQ